MRVLITGGAVLLVSLACAASYTYTGFYTGQIIPTPQQVTYEAPAWDVGDCAAHRARLTIGVGSDGVPLAVALAGEDIANRVHFLSGVELPLPPLTKLPTEGTFLALGLASDPLFNPVLAKARYTVPAQPQGYLILPVRSGKAQGLALIGRDEAGIAFAAQTLVQLLERKGSRLLLHPATVRDWPTYPLRSFKTGGAYDPGSQAADMAGFSVFAKFNCYNICYTSMGADKWVNPPDEYRQFVIRTTYEMRDRGLDCMPFINPYYLWKEHIETSDEGDLVKLFEACRIAPEAGGTRVMLCLDDFASEPDKTGPKLYHVRSKRDQERWGDDLAAVNIVMVNDLARRLKQAYPQCKLYVVPPYYWTPSGGYREEGERNLRALGQGLDPSVTVVWTGPQVRSAIITGPQVDYYQGLLGGRKVMLWDNTIYMHHNPPHYLLDTFHTKYPDKFWEMTTGEVHLNTGGGPIYQCGLLSAADALWNPQAFDPEKSLRHAIAALAGPDPVDDLLAFRDAFYTIYDSYGGQFGKPEVFLAKVKTMASRPFDETGMAEVNDLLDQEQALARKLAAACTNKPLAAEIATRAQLHQGYRDAMALMAKLPPMTGEDAANTAPNPDAEQVAKGKPVSWGLYRGAGEATLTAAPGRTGGSCGKLTATKLHDWGDGRKSINVALMLGDSDGFMGDKAPALLAMHGYYYSFWMKGTAPRVTVSLTAWDDKGTRESRANVPPKPAALTPTKDWSFISGQFVTPPTAARGCLKVNIEGYTDQGAGLGEVCVDDVYVGRSKRASLKDKP